VAPFYHFSVDDVFEALVRASDSGRGLFDEPLFAFLRGLNARFGTRVDLYLFLQGVVDGAPRHLEDVSDRLRRDFEGAAGWLRLGPHALDYETPPYTQSPAEQAATLGEIYAEIRRFAGGAALSRWLRLHYFSECFELAPFLLERGVEALLLTDKAAISYRGSEALRRELCTRGAARLDLGAPGGRSDLSLVRSHLRVEYLARGTGNGAERTAALTEALKRHGFLVLFTHEVDLRERLVRRCAEECLAQLAARSIASI
jgi:hypothetical protein